MTAIGRILAVIPLAFALSCATGAAPEARRLEADARVARVAAEDLERAELFEDARRAFRALRTADPNDLDALRREIRLTTKAEDIAAVLDELTAADDDPRLRARRLGLASELAIPAAERRALLDEALKLDPSAGTAHIAAALAEEEIGEFDRAAAHWRLALSDPGTEKEALRGLSIRLVKREAFDEAKDLLHRYLDLVPTDARACFDLGTIYLEHKNDVPNAYRWLGEALRLGATDAETLSNYSVACAQSGEIAEAYESLLRAKLASPKDPDIYYNLAVLSAEHRKDRATAVACFEIYLKLGGADVKRVERWIAELRN